MDKPFYFLYCGGDIEKEHNYYLQIGFDENAEDILGSMYGYWECRTCGYKVLEKDGMERLKTLNQWMKNDRELNGL